MDTPVFVIHGIGNRDEAAFVRTVDALASAVGGITAHPVYWGDLGARYELISHTVPGASVSPTEVRGSAIEPTEELDALSQFLMGTARPGGDETRDNLVVPTYVLSAATEAFFGQSADAEEVRGGVDEAEADDLRVALSEHWASTRWLCRLDDEQLLRTIGATLGHEVAEELAVYPDEGFEVRGAEVRAIDIGGFVSRRLHDLDRVVGAAFGAAGSRLNTHFRTSLLPGITQFVGDILVYQRHREAIGDRVRRVIDGVEPGLGRTPDNPVDILAHSLGGVIAFDLAASEDPLWVRRLITFGSQPSFFHVSDPRGGTLDAYSGTPVQLPQSIGTWTNLWEPLDPLAFVVARVFRLHHGSLPDDKKVSHLASSGVWTHSGYWGLADVAREIRDALA